jgi:hypothetical protein
MEGVLRIFIALFLFLSTAFAGFRPATFGFEKGALKQ